MAYELNNQTNNIDGKIKITLTSYYYYQDDILGKGNNAEVFKGYNRINNKIVAIKKIYVGKVRGIPEKIRQEYNSIRKLNHPNILKYYDIEYNLSTQSVYLIIEYCSKGDLSKYQKKRPIKEYYCQYFTKQIVNGLKYLYDNNIIHRDLKPQNILIGNNNIIKISDFDLAKHYTKNEIFQTWCGTPVYMAPEVLNREPYTINSDLWSLGIILYEMFTGHNPFKVNNLQALLTRIERVSIEIPPNFDVSDNGKDLVYRLLQVNPVNRMKWKDLFLHTWFSSDLLNDLQNELLNFEIYNGMELPDTKQLKTTHEIFAKNEESKLKELDMNFHGSSSLHFEVVARHNMDLQPDQIENLIQEKINKNKTESHRTQEDVCPKYHASTKPDILQTDTVSIINEESEESEEELFYSCDDISVLSQHSEQEPKIIIEFESKDEIVERELKEALGDSLNTLKLDLDSESKISKLPVKKYINTGHIDPSKRFVTVDDNLQIDSNYFDNTPTLNTTLDSGEIKVLNEYNIISTTPNLDDTRPDFRFSKTKKNIKFKKLFKSGLSLLENSFAYLGSDSF